MLLSKAEWDKEQLIRDLREEWGIVDEEPDEGDEDVENSDDAVVMRVGGMMLIVTLFHGHIPDNEAEINAENNYMWPEAVEVAKAHKAHIMVAVLGEEEKLLERGKLFTKAMAVCCKQKYATGVYTSGVVFEPRFYKGLADMLKEDVIVGSGPAGLFTALRLIERVKFCIRSMPNNRAQPIAISEYPEKSP